MEYQDVFCRMFMELIYVMVVVNLATKNQEWSQEICVFTKEIYDPYTLVTKHYILLRKKFGNCLSLLSDFHTVLPCLESEIIVNIVFVSKNQQLTFCKIIYNSIFILANPSFLSTFTFGTRFSPYLSKSCNLQVLRWHYRLEKVILAFNRSRHSFENIFQCCNLVVKS